MNDGKTWVLTTNMGQKQVTLDITVKLYKLYSILMRNSEFDTPSDGSMMIQWPDELIE